MHTMTNVHSQLRAKMVAMTGAHESQFYTVSEAARMLDVSPSTIWRWIEAQVLAAYRKTVDTGELILAAHSLAHQHNCALYLALAQRLDLPLITADAKLYWKTRPLRNVIWIGHYSPPQDS